MSHVAIAGAGNIGSHLVPHVARMAGVSRVSVIDRDSYEAGNLASQDIEAADVGRAKARVQARRLGRINSRLEVTAVHADLTTLPLGAFRADVILACLDSRAARMAVNQAAWRLGVPWINGGVDAGAMLGRVQVFLPSATAPCLECAWDQADYDAVEQRYPCATPGASGATGATSGLGALVASYQAIECEKVLAGRIDDALIARDLMVDAEHHRQLVTSFRRNDRCRMPDHEGWRIAKLDQCALGMSLSQILTLGPLNVEREDAGDAARVRLGVAGQRWVHALTCRECGARRKTAVIERATRARASRCRHCGGPVFGAGRDLDDVLRVETLTAAALDRSLARAGIREGDVLSFFGATGVRHFEIEAFRV